MANIIEKILEDADIVVDGQRPWDLKINKHKITKDKLFSKIMSGGSLAVGESYMNEEWEVDDLADFFYRVMRKSNFDNLLTFGDFWYFIKKDVHTTFFWEVICRESRTTRPEVAHDYKT